MPIGHLFLRAIDRREFRCVVPAILLTIPCATIFPWKDLRGATAQTTPPKSGTSAVSRPCKTTDDLGARKQKDKKKQTTKAPEEVPPACIEAQATVIEVQEYLQNYVREHGWSVHDELMAVDSWTFKFQVGKEDLSKCSQSDPGTVRIAWTSGQAFVQIRTVELEEGFTRVQIQARFEGYGQNQDQFAPEPKSWPLRSNGELERRLVAALAAHLQSVHPASGPA